MDSNQKIQELSNLFQLEEQRRYKKEVVEFYTSILSKTYDKASTYTNIIIMAGYALFFTFWAQVKDEVAAVDARLSAVYVLISVLIFLVWEIFSMIRGALNLKNLNGLTNVPADKFRDQMAIYNKKNEEFNASFTRYWFYQLLFTIVFGFSGAVVLIWAYFNILLK